MGLKWFHQFQKKADQRVGRGLRRGHRSGLVRAIIHHGTALDPLEFGVQHLAGDGAPDGHEGLAHNRKKHDEGATHSTESTDDEEVQQ